MCVVKIIDIMMEMKWFSIEGKDTWTLIYFVNYMFDLHDIFIGSFISQRLVITAKKILQDLISQRSKTNNNEQIYEINALLNTDTIKANKSMLSFDDDTKEISELF